MRRKSTIEEALKAANLEQYINNTSTSPGKQSKVVVNRQKQEKKVQKQENKSRWSYEVPDLELTHLYNRIKEIKDHHHIQEMKREAGEVELQQRPSNPSKNNRNDSSMNEQLRNYITRSFKKCNGSKKHEKEMTKLLKNIVDDARQKQQIMVIDWNIYPLPLLSSEKLEKNKLNFNKMDNSSYGLNKIDKGVSKVALQKNLKSQKKPDSQTVFTLPKEYANRRKQKREVSPDDEPLIDTHENLLKVKDSIDANDINADLILQEKLKIVGTCKDLEKKFYRLTEVPDPSTVRPESVLKRALTFVLNKFKAGKANERYAQDQLRSIRQDLLIQSIRTEFTVKVYEENALFSLSVGDADQFNKCQMQLYDLYSSGLKGRREDFLMYRMVYLILNSEKNVLNRFLKEQTEEDLESQAVHSAFELKKKLIQGNIHYVFGLLKEGDEGIKNLVKMFLEKIRIWALQIYAKSFGDKISFEIIEDRLCFSSTTELLEFLESLKCSIDKQSRFLLLKKSRNDLLSNIKMRDGFD